jgi:hypothetical protein
MLFLRRTLFSSHLMVRNGAFAFISNGSSFRQVRSVCTCLCRRLLPRVGNAYARQLPRISRLLLLSYTTTCLPTICLATAMLALLTSSSSSSLHPSPRTVTRSSLHSSSLLPLSYWHRWKAVQYFYQSFYLFLPGHRLNTVVRYSTSSERRHNAFHRSSLQHQWPQQQS